MNLIPAKRICTTPHLATLLLLTFFLTPQLCAQGSFGHASIGVAFEKGRGRPMLHAAIGGERRFGSSDLGWGGEAGILAFRNVDPSTLGLATLNVAYHPRGQSQIWDPYLMGGGTVAFSGIGNAAAGLTYGGGMNRFAGSGFGARLEFRHTPFRGGTDGFDIFILRVGMLFH